MMTTNRTPETSFVRRYSIVLFCLLAFVLGAGMVYFVIWSGLPPDLVLASVLSASIAGIIMTAVEDGRAGLKLMLSRLLIWRAAWLAKNGQFKNGEGSMSKWKASETAVRVTEDAKYPAFLFHRFLLFIRSTNLSNRWLASWGPGEASG